MTPSQTPTWEQVVVKAMRNLEGRARLCDLYDEVVKVCKSGKGRKLTTFYREKVRQVVQKSDWFVQYKPGSGVWHLSRRTHAQ